MKRMLRKNILVLTRETIKLLSERHVGCVGGAAATIPAQPQVTNPPDACQIGSRDQAAC